MTLTPAQTRWTDQMGTHWPSLWAVINKTTKKLRSPVASFTWRLLNMCLPWNTREACPLCHNSTSSASHLFLECKLTTDLYSPPPLQGILTQPHNSGQQLKLLVLAVWSQWKLITWIKHHPKVNVSKLDRFAFAHSALDEEIERALATGWWQE